MKTFRELVIENLTYTVAPEDVLHYKGLENYKMTNKGNVMLYTDEKTNKPIFSLDIKKKTLTVLKQGWQLMNVKRGF